MRGACGGGGGRCSGEVNGGGGGGGSGSGGARVTRLLGRKSNAGGICSRSRLALASLSLLVWLVAALPWFRSVATCKAIKRAWVGRGRLGTGFPFLHLGRAPQSARSAAPGPTASDSAAEMCCWSWPFPPPANLQDEFLPTCACVPCGSSRGGPAQARCSVAIA